VQTWGWLLVPAVAGTSLILISSWTKYVTDHELGPRAQLAVALMTLAGGAAIGAAGLVSSARGYFPRISDDWLQFGACFILGAAWVTGGNMLAFCLRPRQRPRRPRERALSANDADERRCIKDKCGRG
jgi:hypothetical protein